MISTNTIIITKLDTIARDIGMPNNWPEYGDEDAVLAHVFHKVRC